MQAQPGAAEALTGYYTKAFGFDVPLWKQYLNFWAALFHGDLGRSIMAFPTAGLDADHGRAAVHARAARAGDPAQLLGREQGRRARRPPQGRSTTRVLPFAYVLTATPQMWLGIVLAWLFASTLAFFPVSGAYGLGDAARVVARVRRQLPLPLVPAVHGALPRRLRRLGDRDAEHDHLRARGRLLATTWPRSGRRPSSCASTPTGTRCCRRSPASRSHSARSSPARSSSRSSSRIPGLGTLTLQAIQNRDYFLIQGIFLFVIIGVLIANFLIDIAYVFIDPRTRVGMQGGADGGLRPARGRGPRRRRGDSDRCRGAARDPLAGGAAAGPSSSISRCGTGSSSIGLTAVGAMLLLALVGPALTAHTPLAFTGPTDARPSGGVLVRHDLVRPGRLRRSSSTGCAPRSSSAPSAAGSRAVIGDGGRVHRRLPRRLARRPAQHAARTSCS